MIKLIVEHKVKDFTSWKKVFDERADMMTKYGGSNFTVGRDQSNKNDIQIIGDFQSKKNFEDMWNSTELKNALKDSGVISEPKITFLDEKARG